MPPKIFDPLHLDVEAFAKAGAELQGDSPLGELKRLRDSADPQAAIAATDLVAWKLRGEERKGSLRVAETWLNVVAHAHLSMTCQRCLGPVPVALDLDHWVRFVQGEDAAAALDAESDEDVLSLTRSLNAKDLIEDELLLALPLVPRHGRCPAPLVVATDESMVDDRPQPFAALAKWKPNGKP